MTTSLRSMSVPVRRSLLPSAGCDRSSAAEFRGIAAALGLLALAASTTALSAPRAATVVSYGTRWDTYATVVHGTRVLIVRDRQSNMVSVGLRIQVGYFSDPPRLDGLAHFVEHMVVHSTNEAFSESLHDWRLRDQGRGLSAHTDTTYTDYVISSDASERGTLAERLISSLHTQQFEESKAQQVLQEIDDDQRRYSSSPGGRMEAAEGSLVSRDSQFRRIATSGSSTALRSTSMSDLIEAAQAFVAESYRNHIAALVVMSPRPVSESLEMIRAALREDGFAANVSANNFSARAFTTATSSPHALSTSQDGDSIRFLYELSPLPEPEAFWLFRRISAFLGSSAGDSFASEVRSRGLASDVEVSTDPYAFGDHGAFQIDFKDATPSADSATSLRELAAAYTAAALKGNSSTAMQTASADSFSRLISAQPRRPALVEGLLESVSTGARGAALDFHTEPPLKTRERAQLGSTAAISAPLVLLISGRQSADGAHSRNDAPTQSLARPLGLQEYSQPASGELAKAARCIEKQPAVYSNCLRSLWSVRGLRFGGPIRTPVDRSVVRVLLEDSAESVRSRYANVLGNTGGGLEDSANTVASVGAYGPPSLLTQLLEEVRSEFIRRRDGEAIQRLRLRVNPVPRQSFDVAYRVLVEQMGVFGDKAAAEVPVEDFTLSVERLQAGARSARSEHFDRGSSSPSGLQKSAEVPLLASPTAPLRIPAPSEVSTFMSLWCAEPSRNLLIFRRAATAPLHASLWSQAASTRGSDPDAFGVYLGREEGPYLCQGNSLDSGNLTDTALQQAAEEAIERAKASLCSMTSQQWIEFKDRYLRESSLAWSLYQQYSLDDLRLWMQTGASHPDALAITTEVLRIDRGTLCRVVSTGLSSANAGRSIIVSATNKN